MKRLAAILLVSAAAMGTALAQGANQAPPNYACPGPEYQQFKFWVGEWDVVATQTGKPAGQSKIDLLAAGCIIFENWKGANGGSGHSINVYDQADGKWHQTWVDATGDQVHYIGTWNGKQLDLRAEDISTPQKAPVIVTMTFEPLPNGDVRQSGTQSRDGGKTFQSSFDLTYKKRKK